MPKRLPEHHNDPQIPQTRQIFSLRIKGPRIDVYWTAPETTKEFTAFCKEVI